MQEKNQNTFVYTYSARNNEEVRAIRDKYLPKPEDKMEQLRKLDRSAAQKGTAAALNLGLIGCLLLGIGMSSVTVFGNQWFVPGIVIGLLGIAVLGAAYPLYRYTFKKQKEKVTPQILKLTEELIRQ